MTEQGSLRTYLGTAPGVGKTHSMLAEGRRRAEGGERVVVGWLEGHDRPATGRQLGDLEVIEPRIVSYKGSVFTDLDLEAVISSGADLVLVDELAHRTPDGARHRWQDVADMLAIGLDVTTTTNVANLSSVRDYVARITDVGAVEFVPDDFVRSGEVVLVDLPPDALRQRIASGAVFSCDQIGGALANYFRVSNLEALSELAQAWMDGSAEAVGDDLLVRRSLVEPPEQRVVLAGDSGSPWGERVIRRAALVARESDAQLVVAHVIGAGAARRRRSQRLQGHRDLTGELGGTYIEIHDEVPAKAPATAARARGASSVVVARHRSRLGELAHGSVSAKLRRRLPDVSVEDVRDELAATTEGTESFEREQLTA